MAHDWNCGATAPVRVQTMSAADIEREIRSWEFSRLPLDHELDREELGHYLAHLEQHAEKGTSQKIDPMPTWEIVDACADGDPNAASGRPGAVTLAQALALVEEHNLLTIEGKQMARRMRVNQTDADATGQSLQERQARIAGHPFTEEMERDAKVLAPLANVSEFGNPASSEPAAVTPEGHPQTHGGVRDPRVDYAEEGADEGVATVNRDLNASGTAGLPSETAAAVERGEVDADGNVIAGTDTGTSDLAGASDDQTNENGKYQCAECAAEFDTARGRDSHRKQVHG